MTSLSVPNTKRRDASKQRESLPKTDAPTPRNRSVLIMGAIGSALMWASHPPIAWGWLAWVAPVPWLLLIQDERLAGRRPYRALWIAGFGFWFAALHYLRLPYWATSFGWVAISIYCGCYLPLFVGLTRVAVHRWHCSVVVAAPVVWSALELVRAHFLSGFTMAHLAHTQIDLLPVIQWADVVGVHGTSAVVMLVAASVARMLPWSGRRLSWWPAIVIAAVAVATGGYAALRMDAAPVATGPKIALVQGSIDTEVKMDPSEAGQIVAHYVRLTLDAVAADPEIELVIWPETMFPYPLRLYDDSSGPPQGADWTRDDLIASADESRRRLREVVQVVGKPMLIGVDILEHGAGTVDLYNSSILVDETGEELARYDKTHPVMFGEYIPGGDLMPWIYDVTPLTRGLMAGQRDAEMEFDGRTLAIDICFENLLPHLIRNQLNAIRARGEEPDILVNVTNDGWFWGSSELDMHLACAVFRAVEHRKPMLVAANTGFSASIDANGRRLAVGPRRDTGVLVVEPAIDGRTSVYGRIGDAPTWLALAVCMALGMSGWQGRRSQSAS